MANLPAKAGLARAQAACWRTMVSLLNASLVVAFQSVEICAICGFLFFFLAILQSGGCNPFKIPRNRPRNRCKQLRTKVILAMGSLLVEMAYPTENKRFILMGSFAAAGSDLHPCPPSASHLCFRRFGYRTAIS